MAKSKKVNIKVDETQRPLRSLWRFVVWITGVLVSLAVGFGMVGENGVPVLGIPYVNNFLVVAAGWIVVILTVLSVLLKIIDKMSHM